ncbi:MAG: phosphorylase family protein [Candidatus Bipolaricaulia bacterium]
MILITAALERELEPFRRIAPPGVALLVTGIGRERVERALGAFLVEHRPQIELLVSCGFAGGLAPSLGPGALVLAEQLLLEDGQEIEVEKGLLSRAFAALEPLGASRGPVLTVAKPVRTVEEKRRLGQKTRALAVEMEAFWAAEFARAHGVPSLAVKAVLDPLEQALPKFIEALAPSPRPGPDGDEGHHQLALALATTLARRPWQAWSLGQLAGTARLASRQLALALEALVSGLTIEVASGGPL